MPTRSLTSPAARSAQSKDLKVAMIGGKRNAAEAREAARLWVEQGWSPRPDARPVPIQIPYDWAADPLSDSNWRFQLNAWRPMDVWLTLHHLDRDLSALRHAVDLMLDWLRFESMGQHDRLMWNDMGTGIRACKLAHLLRSPDLAELDLETRDTLELLARRHLDRLKQPAFLSRSNHAISQLMGMTALCRVGQHWPETEGVDDYVHDRLVALLRTQFGHEGVHLEHSPGYHFFSLSEFRRLLNTGWFGHVPELAETIAKAEDAAPWLLAPDGLMIPFGDTGHKRRSAPKPVLEDPVVGRLFREAGYAAVRRNWSFAPGRSMMLFVGCGHHSKVHKHADDLSFVLFEQGRDLVVDTGKFTYNRAGPWRPYTDSARAHNTIDVLDERPDNGLTGAVPTGGGLSSMRRTGWGWAISGAYERPPHGFRHTRTFLYRPAHWLVILDELECDRVRSPTAWLHLAPDVPAQRDGDGWRFDRGDIRYVSDQRLELIHARGSEEPVQGWMATGYHTKVENDALGVQWTGQGGRLATIIGLDDHERPEVSIGPEGFAVHWRGKPIRWDYGRAL